jgi:hypothetical protein
MWVMMYIKGRRGDVNDCLYEVRLGMCSGAIYVVCVGGFSCIRCGVVGDGRGSW